jgi:hypothetical protein
VTAPHRVGRDGLSVAMDRMWARLKRTGRVAEPGCPCCGQGRILDYCPSCHRAGCGNGMHEPDADSTAREGGR